MLTDIRGERVDLRKLFEQFKKKLGIIIAATIVGAIIGVLAYVLYSNIKSGNEVYQIRNDYYIYLNYEDYDNSPDFYNAYTWDGILRDDPIVNYALSLDSTLSKEDILSSVSGEILGDYRILTVVVRGTDADKVSRISEAYKEALPHFAEIIDMIEHIDLWTDSSMEKYDEYTREGNAAFLGGFIALVISLFSVLIMVILDDRIYSERDWLTRYGADIPYLGREGSEEYKLNVSYILGNADYYYLDVEDFDFKEELMEALRANEGVILKIEMGKTSGQLIDKVITTLNKQDVELKAVTF